MRLSASIMAHPARVDLVTELMTALGQHLPTAWDDEGPPSGNADRGWRTARQAWQLADPDADYHLVLQDDAWPCADLLAGLERALDLTAWHDVVVSPYLGKGGITPPRFNRMAADADRAGASWVVSAKLLWGVAICLPTRLIPDMIERADRMAGVTDDMRVAGWAQRRHIPIRYTWPSLVDHRSVESITKHRARERVAQRHHQGSALEIDWSGPVVQDPMFALLNRPRSGPRTHRQVT